MQTLSEIVELAHPELSVLDDAISMGRQLSSIQDLQRQEISLVRLAKAADKRLPIIDIRVALTAGGMRSDARIPRLALAWANLSGCLVVVEHEGTVRWYFDGRWGSDNLRIEHMASDGGIMARFRENSAYVAAMPLIHPSVRPKKLADDHYVLWEPETWTEARSLPDGDPYLLRRLYGDYFAVLASWELTETEVKALRAARL